MSDLLRLLLLSSWSLVLCDNTENISVKAGQNVILECRAQVSLNDVITLLKWKKPELKSESYVFFFRDNHFNGDYQDERFLGRVQLSDQQMKDGDVSVVLKNVTADDSGTYECNVKVEHNGQRRVRRHGPKPVSVVKLTVTEPGTTGAGEQGGDKGGHSGLIAAGAVIGVIGVIVTGLILVLIRRRKNSDQPAGDAEEERLRETPELS